MNGGFLGGIETLSGKNTFNVMGGTVGDANGVLVSVGANTQGCRYGSQAEFDECLKKGMILLDRGELTINADASQLYGVSTAFSSAYLAFHLTGGSHWRVRSVDGRMPIDDSYLSLLTIDNSTLEFDTPPIDPTSGDALYHAVSVGYSDTNGVTDVYKSNNGHIIFNTFVNDGGLPSNQYTDKVRIKGDVVGKTKISVKEMAGSTGDVDWTSKNGTNLFNEGISLVQVTGKAASDSFYLDYGYTTFHRQPYMYGLYGFEDTTAGTWDFRLQNEWLWDGDGWVRQVVPQVSTYLTAPNALFRARNMDLSNLRDRFDTMRQGSNNKAADLSAEEEERRKREFFAAAYGGTYDYKTDLAILEYGYNADIDYTAMQFGGNLYGVERDKDQEGRGGSEFLFGLSGSYGSLAFETDREDSRKSKIDVYSVTPYVSWLKDSGFYANFALSYGMFNGKVASKRYARAGDIKGSSLAASIEVGMPFALGGNGWTVEPQAGFVYQKLSFKSTEDADNFPVELGSPVQMMGRVGGKLTKDMVWGNTRSLSIYGKLNYLHDITGDNHEVWLGDDFQVGKFGNHVEAGLGFNLAMMRKLSLFGDFTWTQAVGSVGNSGISFNVGGNLKF